MMCTPRQRGAYTEVQRCGSKVNGPKNAAIDYCPHCLNNGPVCGGKGHMIGGAFAPRGSDLIVETYEEGQVVNLEAEIDTNHNGYFEFHLCDLDSCGSDDLDQKCFDTNNCHKLERVPHKDCENPNVDTAYECGPIDKNYPTRWYLPCRKTGHVGVHIVGGKSGTMQYKLPKGVSCKHCVIQWYWQTANSCNPPGTVEYFSGNNMPFGTSCPGDGGASGAHNPQLRSCGVGAGEQFWSCADVMVMPATGGRPVPEIPNNSNGMGSGMDSGKDMNKNEMINNMKPNKKDGDMYEDSMNDENLIKDDSPTDDGSNGSNWFFRVDDDDDDVRKDDMMNNMNSMDKKDDGSNGSNWFFRVDDEDSDDEKENMSDNMSSMGKGNDEKYPSSEEKPSWNLPGPMTNDQKNDMMGPRGTKDGMKTWWQKYLESIGVFRWW